MSAQLTFARCATCANAIISGVACESAHAPADCPLLESFRDHHDRRLSRRGLRVIPSDCALPGEYDVVRSEG
jgi:hypothetical protein